MGFFGHSGKPWEGRKQTERGTQDRKTRRVDGQGGEGEMSPPKEMKTDKYVWG